MRPRDLETILLVDDEPHVVTMVREMLRREGYKVLDAEGGEEAIQVSQQYPERIDLLVTDIVMPQMNGRELADRLVATRPGLKVLYMSGFMKETITKYYGIPISGIPFLQKPFTRETLARRVRELLDETQRSASEGR